MSRGGISSLTAKLRHVQMAAKDIERTGFRLNCKFCKASGPRDICKVCEEKIDKNALIGAGAYEGITMYVINLKTNEIVHTFTNLKWMEEVSWLGEHIAYSIVLRKAVLGGELRSSMNIYGPSVTSKDLYMLVVDIIRKENQI